MALPVLVEVTRGDMVESRHRGSFAIVHADSGLLFAAGATEDPVYPRSTVKVIQALPLVESGAADELNLSDYELALCCASHSGERRHVETANALLERIGLGESALACGPHWPSVPTVIADMGKAGETPTRCHNNCSGKHAGMLAVAGHMGEPQDGYEGYDHPVQARIRQVMADVFGRPMDDFSTGIDGCSLPTIAIPLSMLARGFARLTGDGSIAIDRRAAADRLMKVCMAEPHAVGGEGRFDTQVMQAFGGRVFAKGGAEGVHVVVFPKLKIAAAIKMEDGAARASEVAAAAIISRFALQSAEDHDFIEEKMTPPVKNAAGAVCGQIRPAVPFLEALRTL